MWRHALIRALIQHFLSELGYSGKPVHVTVKPTKAIEAARRRKMSAAYRRDVYRDHAWVIEYPKRWLVYVNVDRHETFRDLIDSAAHEALHIATGKMSHRKEGPHAFQSQVDALVRSFHR